MGHSHFAFLFFCVKDLAPSPICLEYWVFLNRSNSLDPPLQNRNNCIPLFSLYTWELNLGKPYGIKLRCYWEHLEEQLENLRNLTTPTFFFGGNEPISLAYHQKTNKSWNYGGSQTRRLYGKKNCLVIWPTYIGENGRTLGKTYGIQGRCYWEHPWWTHWEPDGNPLGTWREHGGNKGFFNKNPPPPLQPKT